MNMIRPFKRRRALTTKSSKVPKLFSTSSKRRVLNCKKRRIRLLEIISDTFRSQIEKQIPDPTKIRGKKEQLNK